MFEFLLMMASANAQFFGSLSPVLQTNQPLIQEEMMAQNSRQTPFNLSVSLLEAYENTRQPLGASANYPIGHAVVRLRIENLTQNNIIANLTKVEIRQSSDNSVLMSETVNPFDLGGLQILEKGFHLTNSKGFMGANEVKAVVIYELNGNNYTVESPNLKVIVYP